uniref:Uncharacterized protein n=1 Tax=Physcomitrium patens TaxID=3218 RepID=A0A2K1K7P2_PHYPA|nr:hypothetical protein PHYPA_011696 [Physcomitrium patens]
MSSRTSLCLVYSLSSFQTFSWKMLQQITLVDNHHTIDCPLCGDIEVESFLHIKFTILFQQSLWWRLLCVTRARLAVDGGWNQKPTWVEKLLI